MSEKDLCIILPLLCNEIANNLNGLFYNDDFDDMQKREDFENKLSVAFKIMDNSNPTEEFKSWLNGVSERYQTEKNEHDREVRYFERIAKLEKELNKKTND
jgi:hypothetical protein